MSIPDAMVNLVRAIPDYDGVQASHDNESIATFQEAARFKLITIRVELTDRGRKLKRQTKKGPVARCVPALD